ncbi:MAG: transcriptional regulator NrdR [Rickettsiaceae bacterium]|nr:transcriptional regulator NrdR [Rickettsiaceae bacterium]
MKCPFCQSINTFVKDSRISTNSENVRRRRSCVDCKAKFSTIEQPILKELYVVKRSGTKKPFERKKIYNAIQTALRKRETEDGLLEKIVNKICLTLQTQQEKEIPTRRIGDMILEELALIDEVAYIRFASVYKDFMSASDFSRFINLIKSQKKKSPIGQVKEMGELAE